MLEMSAFESLYGVHIHIINQVHKTEFILISLQIILGLAKSYCFALMSKLNRIC